MSEIIEIYRVRQPGFLPWLIRLGTRSKWNHIIMKLPGNPTGFYIGLDLKGREYYEPDFFPKNWKTELAALVEISEVELARLVRKIPRYQYSQLDNMVAFLGYWFPKFREHWCKERPGSLNTNCVGFIEQLLRKPLSYKTPGNWEYHD